MTMAELLALPATVDVPTAARALGLGRNTGYRLAASGEFPCRVLRLGRHLVVPTADLCRCLGITPSPADPPGHTPEAQPRDGEQRPSRFTYS